MAAMITIANANALHIPLADRSVQCVVTSPPYWGLRDYGTAKWEGGDPACEHRVRENHNAAGTSTLLGGKETVHHAKEGFKDTCPRCGARRIDAQIGLESTPAAYVANIVAVMRECWRVLKDDGVLWLNLGDSYASDMKGSGGDGSTSTLGITGHAQSAGGTKRSGDRQRIAEPRRIMHGLKPKDLCGIPWRVAFALQSDGAASPETMRVIDRIKVALLSDFDTWEAVPDKTRNAVEALDREWENAHRGAWYLRQDIIWSKPNPMPESVTDRCTKAHEYIFLLTKQARYYYDAIAIAEEALQPNGIAKETAQHKAAILGQTGGTLGTNQGASTRNRRSVWTVATSPYSGAHFAVWPSKLIEPMILAGTSQRGECPHCGKAWVRVVEKSQGNNQEWAQDNNPSSKEIELVETGQRGGHGKLNRGSKEDYYQNRSKSTTLGWRPQCNCIREACPDIELSSAGWDEVIDRTAKEFAPIPQTVLDPFAGSGTTGAVAVKYGRRAVLLDLNTKYIYLQFDRTNGVQMTMPE